MTRQFHKRFILPQSVVAQCATAGVSSGKGLGLRVESGTVLPYEALEEVGNGVGVHLTYDLESIQLCVGGGVVFPGSQVGGALLSGEVMGQWHLFRGADWAQRSGLSPYASLGLGLVSLTEDDESDEPTDGVEIVRWIHHDDQFTGLLGLGVTYGVEGDLYVSAEARAVNHTHLALLLGAGASF